MSNAKNHFEFAAILTESGLVKLRNLIEEYQFGLNLSENKLGQLNSLLVTFYFETKNLIHLEIFSATNNHFNTYGDKGKKIIQESIKILHENGFLKRNPKHKQIIGERYG